MVNLAEKHDYTDSVQLADAEISRILSALHHAEFKKSETQNTRVDQTFKPRSLMEIAEDARLQDEAAEAAKQALDQTETAQDTGQDTAPVDDLEPPMATVQAPEMQPDMPAVGDAGQTPKPDAAEQLNLAASAGDVAASTDNGSEADSKNALAQATPTSPFETAQAAYDRGYTEGVTAGRTAAENELRVTIQAETEANFADRVSTFETALMALVKPQSVDIELLSKTMQAAVIKLAEARIGMAIDELPDIMLTRIEALSKAVGKKAATGKVIMHPDDCAVMAPILADWAEPVVVEANPALNRGDIRVKFEGVEIDDFLELRIADKSAGTHRPTGKEIDDASADDSDETDEVSVSEEAPGLMPLTGKSTDDGVDETDEVSVSDEAPGLMPLTSDRTDEEE
jgi:flagellar biosynthesis/type III secretory pathway protein FliH